MNSEIDKAGFDFAVLCQENGMPGFSLYLKESGDVRLIGLSLPAALVTEMLRTAADIYEASMEPETLN